MDTQRLMYSQTKKPRATSLNKENNIRLFNHDELFNLGARVNDRNLAMTNDNKKIVPSGLRYDYDKKEGRRRHNFKTIFAEDQVGEHKRIKQNNHYDQKQYESKQYNSKQYDSKQYESHQYIKDQHQSNKYEDAQQFYGHQNGTQNDHQRYSMNEQTSQRYGMKDQIPQKQYQPSIQQSYQPQPEALQSIRSRQFPSALSGSNPPLVNYQSPPNYGISCGLFPKVSAHSSNQQQISIFTNKLLQNNKSYQQQIFTLKQQTNRLRIQLQQSIGENIRTRMEQQKSEESIRAEFNVKIQQLVKELKELLEAKQEMEKEYKEYIQEMLEEHMKQMTGREETFLKSQQLFKQKLSQMSALLSCTKQQKQKQYHSASQLKLQLLKQIDHLQYQLSTFKQQSSSLSHSQQQKLSIIKSLQTQLQKTKQLKQEKDIQIYQIQKDKNQLIIQLKHKNKALADGMAKMDARIKDLDIEVGRKEAEMGRMEREMMEREKDNQQRCRKLLEKNIQMEEIKKSKLLNEEQLTRKVQSLSHQNHNSQLLIYQLQHQLTSLTQQLSSTQQSFQSLQLKYTSQQSLLQSSSKQLVKSKQQLQKVQQLLGKYKKDNIQFLEQLQLLTLQNKSLKQQSHLHTNHIKTLQQMCSQLQRTRQMSKQGNNHKMALQKTRNNQQRGDIEQLRILTGNNHQLELEIKNLRGEKDELKGDNQHLKGEIQWVVSQYEQKIIQKEQSWKLRCQTIQNQLQKILNKREESLEKAQRQIKTQRSYQKNSHQQNRYDAPSYHYWKNAINEQSNLQSAKGEQSAKRGNSQSIRRSNGHQHRHNNQYQQRFEDKINAQRYDIQSSYTKNIQKRSPYITNNDFKPNNDLRGQLKSSHKPTLYY